MPAVIKFKQSRKKIWVDKVQVREEEQDGILQELTTLLNVTY